MKTKLVIGFSCVAAAFMCAASPRPYPKVTNVSPNPAGTNEFYLTATNLVVTNFGGVSVHVMAYIDDPPGGGGAPAGLPCPMINLTPGMMVICHFHNNLTNNIEGASIHWHGIELDNDSDGTAISQDSVLPGQGYIYRFVAPRSGLYWYHSHMLPGSETFGGIYGPIVITSNIEQTLISESVLPTTNYTFPLLLSDISFTNGVVGKVVGGTNYSLNTLIQLCENWALGTASNNQPFCGPAGEPGDTVLVNGYPPILSGTTNTPTASSTPLYVVAAHSRVRLQLFNASTGRDFNMSLKYPASNPTGDTNLYRVGGQGGLLDNAVLDGGVQAGYNFLFPQGHEVIGTGMRADVMFYPSGNNGDIIQLLGNPLPQPPWNLSAALPPNYPIAYFIVTNLGPTNAPLAAGAPILAGTGFSNQNLRLLDTNALIPPMDALGGTNSGVIILRNSLASNAQTNEYTPNPASPNIDGYAAVQLDGNAGDGSFTNVQHPPSAVWARIGDVLQMAVINDTGGGTAMHPFHLHGFSMQPIAIMTTNLLTNLYSFPYNEFLDTFEVYPGTALVFRIQLTDRARYADTGIGGPVTVQTSAPSGGGVGRWLMHCHIFLHTTIGMISELDVVSNSLSLVEGPQAGADSVVYAGSPGTIWHAATNVPWLHLSPANQSGTGSANVVFTYDANPGPTRTGSLVVGGELITVTQAGVTYALAGPESVTLVSSGLNNPEDVGVDSYGNVAIADGENNAVKKWLVASNTVTTLWSGLNLPQGISIDSLNNIFFVQFYANQANELPADDPFELIGLNNSGLNRPTGCAVDAAGNVYVADPTQAAIDRWSVTNNAVTTWVGGSFTSPYGVAVDAANNLYIADTGANAIKKWTASTGTLTTLIATNLSSPWNVKVDASGNLYIADGNDGAIKEWCYASNSLTTIASGLNTPTGCAADNYHNVYIADFGDNAVEEVPRAFVDPTTIYLPANGGTGSFPPVLPTTENLNPPFAPFNASGFLTITGNTNGVISFSYPTNFGPQRGGAVTILGEAVSVVQQGASTVLGASNLLVGPDAGSGSVVLAVVPTTLAWAASPNATWLHLSPANVSGSGSTNVVFTYDANAGATRTGTLTIAGNTLTVTQAGQGYVKAPGPQTVLVGSGLLEPSDLALDSSGNVYISDAGNNIIQEWNVASDTVSTIVSSGLDTPQGVAVDSSGNVYISDFYNKVVDKWSATTHTLTTLFPTSFNPEGLAVDSASNLYVADTSDQQIDKWSPTTSTLSVVVSNGLYTPYGVAVDAAGNIYIADTYSNAIREWIAANNTLVTLTSAGLNIPWNVAVDGSGNVYAANGGGGNITEWVAASNVVTTPVTGLSEALDAAVDGKGNIYVADYAANQIDEMPFAYVNATPRTEGPAAGSDSLPVVQLPSENLAAPFFPTTTQPWLSVSGTAGDVVTFNFTANAGTSNRVGNIIVLGQSVQITQTAVVTPPYLFNPRMVGSNTFQFSFTNFNTSATFTVLFSTNIATPLAHWTAIGAASNIGPGLMQFTDNHATNSTRFYTVESP